MKTIVIWDNLEAQLKFFVLDGDYRLLDGLYINTYSEDEAKQRKLDWLYLLVFNPDGTFRVTMLDSFPIEAVLNAPDMDTAVITAGFLP